LPEASSKLNALRGPKPSIYIHCIGKKSEEAKEHQSRTHWLAASRDHDLVTHQHAQAGSQKKGKENNSETQFSSIFHKRRYINKHVQHFLIKSQENYGQSLLHLSKRIKVTRGGQFYATSAVGSVAEEGAGEVAPALGRGINALVVGVKESIVEVKEAAEGVIINTMPSAYFFAFSKEPCSSERGRPREELTFSQLTSSPCA
jgi:hypothetical protein